MKVKTLVLLLPILLIIPLLAGCSDTGTSVTTDASLPDYVVAAGERVQDAYQFAVAHPEKMTHQPCYCGCGPIGHMNLLDCYVVVFSESGLPAYEPHAARCGVCVAIALDIKRLDAEGWSQLEIRHYIDDTYGYIGASTDTPMPEA